MFFFRKESYLEQVNVIWLCRWFISSSKIPFPSFFRRSTNDPHPDILYYSRYLLRSKNILPKDRSSRNSKWFFCKSIGSVKKEQLENKYNGTHTTNQFVQAYLFGYGPFLWRLFKSTGGLVIRGLFICNFAYSRFIKIHQTSQFADFPLLFVVL
jgi:hypothetical protein